MGCWYCYWGWPKKVADIYKKALDALGGNTSPLHFGPAHVVWADENFNSAESCLENFDKYSDNFDKWEMDIVRRSLEELAMIPLEERDIWPDEYDGANPELFPPPDGIEMVKMKSEARMADEKTEDTTL
jgi:hypothetical protein